MDFTLRKLSYFVAAAETGTMTDAAKRLFVSQSAISVAIAELEQHLGAQLLLRQNPRRLALTRAGRTLLVDARRLIADAEELRANASAEGTSVSGRLAVGCYLTLSPFVLPRVIEGFEGAYPDVSLEIAEGWTDDLAAALSNGDLEMAILYDLDLPDGLETIELATVAPYVLVAPEHPLARRKKVSMKALANQDLILFAPPGSYYLSLLRANGVVPRVRYRSGNFETVRSLTARGMGFALLHQRPGVEGSYEGRPLRILEFSDAVPRLRMVVATLTGHRLTRRAETFVQYCRSVFRDA